MTIGAPPGSVSIDEMLAAERAGLRRLSPTEAHARQRRGALLVDIRPVEQRRAHGDIPGAIIVGRNVLEWRLDPRSPDRLEFADRYDRLMIVVCHEGYSSSLAAASLQRLGLYRATDLDGGFLAWHAAGLPIINGSVDVEIAGASRVTVTGRRSARAASGRTR